MLVEEAKQSSKFDFQILMLKKVKVLFFLKNFYKYRCKLYCISIKKFDLICPFLLGFDSPLRFQSWAMVCLVSTDNFNRARDFNARTFFLNLLI